MEVSAFDWLRWVEVPIWMGMVGWFYLHIRHDQEVEKQLANSIGKIETMETTINTMLMNLLEKTDG